MVAIVLGVTLGLPGCFSASERTPLEHAQRNMAKFLADRNVGVAESLGRWRCDESDPRPDAAVRCEFLPAGFVSPVVVHCQPVPNGRCS
jgi:hypothetical protein